ncbi:MAG: 3-phosphoshikimate 1-carboxyvinyltransferase [Saprospiraceae bacterium]|nr:3-phosphoshikimate 1-carboxyvinyltransferase [Saprospiraceae bacterium]
MEIIKISKNNRTVQGRIDLAGSKSISNRALIIQALCAEKFPIYRIANAKDTETLQQLLASESDTLDAGPAGTTFRFMTAFLSLQQGTQTLTGSERMKQRPIGVLVEALKKLGANIEYLENDGYPPLKINAPNSLITNQLSIPASVSSQYISALLMIAPTLKNGLELTLTGKIVSRPYILMTLNLMAYFGIKYDWNGQIITIKSQEYQARPFTVEADWSAASYYYAVAAFANDDLHLQLDGLFAQSVQGDAVMAKISEHFGVQSTFNETGVLLTKVKNHQLSDFKYNFLECPDIAQTLAVICGGLGVNGHFSGLETLKIKETDRVEALYQELKKVKVNFEEQADETCIVSGKATFDNIPQFPTYEDHRMAMAFAPLAMFHAVEIEEPKVVGKSYPDFWTDFGTLGMIFNLIRN